jgi:hypothetical protein
MELPYPLRWKPDSTFGFFFLVKFQQRYVMSHRNVVKCFWDKVFGQFGGSHGARRISQSVLGA